MGRKRLPESERKKPFGEWVTDAEAVALREHLYRLRGIQSQEVTTVFGFGAVTAQIPVVVDKHLPEGTAAIVQDGEVKAALTNVGTYPQRVEKLVVAESEVIQGCGKSNPLKCQCAKCKRYREGLYTSDRR